MSTNNHTMTTSEAARALKRCAETVRGYVASGRLPCTRTASGLRLFAAEDVQRVARELAAHDSGKGDEAA